MKKRFALGLLFLFLLSGCGKDTGIVGVWEQEMTVSILGLEEPAEAESIVRFTFRKNGTGVREQIMPDGSYPSAERVFDWMLEEDVLTLDYGQGQTEGFSVMLEGSGLKLENARGSFELEKPE